MSTIKGHVSQSEFFDRLEKLFGQRKGSDHGAVYLTQKRLVTHSEDAPMPSASDPFPDLHPSEPMPVIIRASNGKSKRERDSKIKFSTIVKPDELDGFYARYADICKAGMTALKPRDRSKKKAKAKKKKTAA
ncbi:Signal recognition particle subunit-like protein [Hapsidospora chrysogenum ATCC 11550]|uniref:Signal recognition particle subunit SRP14 n=1 Tax=Hapsidospora chrysogenum (strain ATCC 11550 / CBS 779.69 / DSM 880 / IAM 14645 / JCM 23072 / IMI 49137) TaxID=857340 RepID=A0A086T0L4_HAPC1|nr:Signal recognition particle subunit-like protein [Hapsidospora chrysogenum ATCC 11550]